MLQINYIRENREEAISKLAKRGFDATTVFEDIIAKDDLRKETQNKLDDVLAPVSYTHLTLPTTVIV